MRTCILYKWLHTPHVEGLLQTYLMRFYQNKLFVVSVVRHTEITMKYLKQKKWNEFNEKSDTNCIILGSL